MTTRSANLGDHSELSEAATALALENALNMSIAGGTAQDKGFGVQRTHDANNKLTELTVFFDDKVPQGEKQAALNAIENLAGIASVQPTEFKFLEDFEGVTGALADQDTAPERNLHVLPSGLQLLARSSQAGASPSNVGVQAGPAPETTAIEQKSTPGSLVSTDQHENKLTLSMLPSTRAVLSAFTLAFDVQLPSGSLTIDPGGLFSQITAFAVGAWDLGGAQGQQSLSATWRAVPTDSGAPTELDFLTGGVWLGGNPANIAIPVDGALHKVSITLGAKGVPGSLIAMIVTVDGVSETFTIDRIVNMFNPLSMFIRHFLQSVSTGGHNHETIWDNVTLNYTFE